MPQLSDAAIRAAKPTPASYTIWDDATKGFGVRVYPAGAKSFIVLVGPGRRQTIGRYPIISLQDARAEARRILAEKTLGKVRPKFYPHEDAQEGFLKDCESRLRPITVRLYRRHLSHHFPFGRSHIADITARQILDRLKNLPLSEKEHAFRIARTFWRWCVAQHLIERSPMEGMQTPPLTPSRERVLSQDELKAVYMTAKSGKTPFHHLVAILTLLGLRRTECASLEWSFFKDGLLTIPGHLTKNKKTHIIPYGETVAGILEAIPKFSDTYLFPAAREGRSATMTGFSERKRDFDTECGVTGWRLHDLRRTFSTNLADLDVEPHVIERLLNHTPGGVQAVYNRSKYARPMKEALALYEQHLSRLLNDANAPPHE